MQHSDTGHSDQKLRLSEIEMREIRMSLREPFRISSGVETERRVVLLRLTDVDGFSVWSECVAMATPNYMPETVDTAWLALESWLLPLAVDQEFETPESVIGQLSRGIRGHQMAKAAIEMGIWALAAGREGKPLAEMIGAQRKEIGVGIVLGIQSAPELLADLVERSKNEGYRRVKVKIGPGSDVAFLEAARDAAGDSVLVMADANSAYTLDDMDVLRAIDDLHLLLIEQPLAWNDFIDHAALQRRIRTPVCLDESITSLRDTHLMIEMGCGRIVNLKPGRVGGFAVAKSIHDLCLSHGLPVWCGGMLETGIGRAYNVALAALEGFSLPGDISPSSRYWETDIVEPEWTMSDQGLVKVPWNRPGLGVDVRTDFIDRLTVRKHVVSA